MKVRVLILKARNLNNLMVALHDLSEIKDGGSDLQSYLQ